MSTDQRKVAIVTGASRGIGAAIAQRLGQDGFSVIVNYAGDSATAEALAKQIKECGHRAFAFKADVSDTDAVKKMFDTVVSEFGFVDVVVNNAGIMELSKIAETTDESFDRQVAVNLKGTFNPLREAARRVRDGGRIINFSSSVVGLLPPTYAVYASIKAAIETMTKILAKELRGRNITVNTVAPGPTATQLFLKDKPQKVIDEFTKLAPLERLGRPEDIAGVVSFLAGPDGGWVNGQTLRANGGIV
ncbi:Short chain dehydrogenase [Labilithrix luteola]|uniref:Short chain dehydrogenase n=1 Tax=Labilithrix luteola TaxID=1391654 RepID=A0A0K1PM04_9BACT|nr:SDR family oxidoreductase [Labilithrix luteola]AKU94555.1 Short chain dehydrogenase [Labilithrix luteola]